jgi:hypothetical protein
VSRGEGNEMYSARLSQSGTQCAESGNSHLARLEKIFEKLFKNLLTKSQKCDIIIM